MYQYWSSPGLVLSDNSFVEGQHRGGIVWDSMVRPGCVVILLHLQTVGLLSMFQLKHAQLAIVIVCGICAGKPYIHLHGPDSVVSKDLLLCEGDLERSVGGAPCLRPVLLALLLVALLQVGHHDYGNGPLLPHQPPEINNSFRNGTFLDKSIFGKLLVDGNMLFYLV